MATRKSSKKAHKKSGKKKDEADDRKRPSGKKAASKKSGSKKAAKRGGAKAAARAASKVATTTAATPALVGNCISLGDAGAIVESAVIQVGGISPASFDIDKKMEQMGVITANQCTLVKQIILNDVRAFPCNINDGAVSIDPSTVARAVRDQVKDNASRP